MSNSKRKTPILPNCNSASEKVEKQKANRKLRRITREKLKKENTNIPRLKEVSDPWNWSKDGKTYQKKITQKQLQK